MPAWLLVLFRLTGVFVFAPLLGSQVVPTRIKALWVAGLSLCIYPLIHAAVLAKGGPSAQLLTQLSGPNFSLLALAAVIAMELAVGVLIGYGAVLVLIGLQMAGHVVDQQIGLGLAEIYNPDVGDQSGVVGQVYYILALMIFVAVGGHRVMLATLLESFQSIPLGGFHANGHLLDLLVGLLGVMLELAIRVAAPVLCLVFLETVAMGFIARTVPQMNILSIGFPLRILVGVSVLVGSVSVQGTVFVEMLHKSLGMIRAFAGAS